MNLKGRTGMSQKTLRIPSSLGAIALLATVVGSGGALAFWKGTAIKDSAAASANQPNTWKSSRPRLRRLGAPPFDHVHRDRARAPIGHPAE
jgi:hypothetical protein